MTPKRHVFSMFRPTISLIFIAFLLVSSLPNVGFSAGKITGFSADWEMTSPDGRSTSTAKLYVTPEAYRLDGMPWGGMMDTPKTDMTIIGLNKLNKQYIYNHDKKLVYESDLDEQEMMDLLKSYQNVDSEEILGKEKVSGYTCIKKKVTTTLDMMGMKMTSTEIIWQSERFDMPLKILGEEGNTSELKNINTKKPAATLFNPLTGYTKVDNMMMIMGMDFSSMEIPDHTDEPSPQNIQDSDPNDIMAFMEQLLGNKESDSEQDAPQVREMLSQILEHARQTDTESGATDDMWEIIPRRPGDRIGNEFKVQDLYGVTLGTHSSFEDVCRYYESSLTALGWQNNARHIQDDVGFWIMTKGNRHLTISSADDPGMDGDFKNFYYLKLSMEPSEDAPEAPTPVATKPTQPPKNHETGEISIPGLLFPNSDFEAGDLTNWTASGTAFDHQPVKGDNPTARNRNQPSRHQGDFWIGTYESYQGSPDQQPGQTQGDRPTGALTSIPFQIAGDRISFLIGGGKRPDAVYVALVVDGQEALKATGNNHETMERHTWDVTAFKDKEARILISDQSSGGWGHINADDFRYEAR
jgi:hypothetical protein